MSRGIPQLNYKRDFSTSPSTCPTRSGYGRNDRKCIESKQALKELRKLNPWMISTFVLAILLLFAARAIFFVPQGYPISNPPTQTPTPTPGTITSPDNATTFTGMIDCLPHRDTSDGQTLECTIGLKTEEGDYYRLQGLNDQDLISGKISVGDVSRSRHIPYT